MKKITLAMTIVALSACSSPGVKNYHKDDVLSTANDTSQPDWADETKPFAIKDGKVLSVGVAWIRGDEIPAAGARVAANNARSNIAKAVENRMEFVFQQGSENFLMDSQTAKFIGSEVSRITSSSMREESTWWARVAQSQEDGSRTIRYKIFSLVTMPEADFKVAVQRALDGSNRERRISSEFKTQLSKQWDRFVEGNTDEKKPE